MDTRKQKLVLITGGGRGIGRAIALQLAEAGYAVSICSRTVRELSEVRATSGGRIGISTVDVSNESELGDWFRGELARTDVVAWALVTSAGIHGPIGSFSSVGWELWKEGIQTNLFGTAYAAKLFTSHLLERKLPGRIVLLSGGGATKPIERFTSYCASKAAVVRFGETLAKELENEQITVNMVAPGLVNTALTETIIDAGPERAGRELYQQTVDQLKVSDHTPERAANLVSYLLGEAAGSVSGRLISARWDNWEHLHQDGTLERNPNAFTLRRVELPTPARESQK